MNFDDLKDQLKEKWDQLLLKIQEHQAYHAAKEQYDNLPVRSQKALLAGASLMGLLTVFSIPYSFYSSSSEYVESYEENREMVRDLFSASRMGSAGFRPPPLKEQELVSRAQSVVNNMQLLSDQIGDIKSVPVDTLGAPLAPATIQQSAAVVQLSQLNLIQINEIGFRLQNLSAGVKLAGLDIEENGKKANYFDVTYKLISFYLEEKKEETEKGKKSKRRKRGR